MGRRWWTSPTCEAIVLGCALFVTYLLNGGLMILADSISNSYLPLSVLNEGNLSYTPEEFPFLFIWELTTPSEKRLISILEITPAVAELQQQGVLRVLRENYNLVPSTRPGLYVNQFGPGAGLTALPVVAIVQAAAGDLMERRVVLAAACRIVSAGCVAASAVLILLTARRFVPRGQALVLALAYGLGTCVWAVSSQSLVQHGPNEFFLALGAYALARGLETSRWHLLTGLAFSAAAMCRPTSVVVAVAVGGYLILSDRRGCVAYVLGALPGALFLAGYNHYYLGSPVTFGQTVQARLYLTRENGVADVWQTPFWVGFGGQLISPSRGLLVYSPWLIFSLVGGVMVWLRREYGWLRPFTVAVATVFLVQSKWFSWWAGWSYGYRGVVDTVPFLALFTLPLMQRVWASRTWLAVGGVCLAWSVFVQALGAWTFDMEGWNARRGYAVTAPGQKYPFYSVSREAAESVAMATRQQVRPAELNIDFPPHERRLWSLSDNQLGYYLTHFGESRAVRQRHAEGGTWIVGRNPALTHYNLGVAFAALGNADRAAEEYQQAIDAQPKLARAYLDLAVLFARQQKIDQAEPAFRKAIELAPQELVPRENLALMLARAGRFAESAEEYERCVQLDPNSPMIRLGLADVLTAQGEDRRAIENYREAIRLRPNILEPRRGLAWCLATSPDAGLRNPREAWGLARELVQATASREPLVLDAAAAAAAGLGRFDEAVRLAELALLKLSADASSTLRQEIDARLALYRRQEAYVRPAIAR